MASSPGSCFEPPARGDADASEPANARALELESQIVAKGDEVRALKAETKAGNADPAVKQLVAELLQLKADYLSLTGTPWLSGKENNKKKPEKQKVNPLTNPPGPEVFPAYAPRDFFRFEIVHQSRKPGSRARVGRLITPHGVVMTPAFVAVGTNAALKGVTSEQMDATGQQLMFCNTYHCLVTPGTEIIKNAGGLHKFMNRDGPLLTDSGGFQVFSLGAATEGETDGAELKSRKKRYETATVKSITEEGVRFKSYMDGHDITLTPESSVQAQKAFGADIIIPLDELPPYQITPERLKESVWLSHRWEARSLAEHLKDVRQQAMYAVVHGGVDRELRAHSARYLSSLPFDGFAIGGSLGKDRDEMVELLEFLMPLLPNEKPTHLLGIGDADSLTRCVPFGIDTADSVWPMRNGRHGKLMLSNGTILDIGRGRYENDHGPIDPELETVPNSRAYLHHLLKAHEPLFFTLAQQHNLYEMNALMAKLREQIMNDEI